MLPTSKEHPQHDVRFGQARLGRACDLSDYQPFHDQNLLPAREGYVPGRKIGKLWTSTPRELLSAVIGREPLEAL